MAGKISMVSFLPAWEKVRLRAHLKTRTTRAYSWHLDCVGKSVTLKSYIVRGLRKQTAHASASCTSDARSRAGSSVEARGTRLVLMNHARLMHGNANGRVWKSSPTVGVWLEIANSRWFRSGLEAPGAACRTQPSPTIP